MFKMAGLQYKNTLDRYGNRKVVEKLEELCPQCGKNLLKRKGRRGFFIACSGFPNCRFTKRLEEPAAQPADPVPSLQLLLRKKKKKHIIINER